KEAEEKAVAEQVAKEAEEAAKEEAEESSKDEEAVEETEVAEETDKKEEVVEDKEETQKEQTAKKSVDKEKQTKEVEKKDRETSKVVTDKKVVEPNAKEEKVEKSAAQSKEKETAPTAKVTKTETVVDQPVVESINKDVTEAYSEYETKEELSDSLSKVVEQTFTAKDTKTFMKTVDENLEDLTPEEFTFLIYKQLSDNKDENTVLATREKDEVETESTSEENLSLNQKRSFSTLALDVNQLKEDVTTLLDEKSIIDADAIESGKIKNGGDFQNKAGIVSGWLDVATDNYTPGINGSQTALNDYLVYLQWIDKDGTVSPVYSAKTHNIGGTRAGQGGSGVYAFDIGAGWTDATGKLHKPNFQSVS